MTARLQLDILVALVTDLTHLEGGAHLAVDLVLLRRHLQPAFLYILQHTTEVHVLTLPIRVQVAKRERVCEWLDMSKLTTDHDFHRPATELETDSAEWSGRSFHPERRSQ